MGHLRQNERRRTGGHVDDDLAPLLAGVGVNHSLADS